MWYKYKILPSLAASQTVLESAWGTVTTGNNNYWGIQSDSADGSPITSEEYIDGSYVWVPEYYRNFPSFEAGLDYWGSMVSSSSRYRNLVGTTSFGTDAYDIK